MQALPYVTIAFHLDRFVVRDYGNEAEIISSVVDVNALWLCLEYRCHCRGLGFGGF